jgi:hypothetical protein
MATKIKDDFELQVSREAVERLRRALAGYKAVPDPDPNCLDGIQFMMEKIEREIEEYLSQKAAETSSEKKLIKAASG